LEQQGAQQLLGGDRRPPRLGVEPGEAPRELPQHRVRHLPDGPQGMVGRNPSLGRHVAEHARLLPVASPHPRILPASLLAGMGLAVNAIAGFSAAC
jgi:hypothetical protein